MKRAVDCVEEPERKDEQEKNVDDFVDALEREGLTSVPGFSPGSSVSRSMTAISRQGSRRQAYGTMEELEETANDLMAVEKKIAQNERLSQSPLLKRAWSTKNRITGYFGMPNNVATPQDLLEEKMRLAERFNQQLVGVGEEVRDAWNQLGRSRDVARQAQIEAAQAIHSIQAQLESDAELYRQVSQQLSGMTKTDAGYLDVVRAKDSLRQRIAVAHASYTKACDIVVTKQKEIEMYNGHEDVMMGVTTRLDCAASLAKQGIDLAYNTHSIAQFYKDGKKKMELFDSLQDIALKFVDVEKEAKDMSDIVERTASKNERTMSDFGRINSRLGEYGDMFRNFEEDRLLSVEQRALDIIASYGE